MDNYWIMELWLFCGCVVCLLTLWSLWFSYDTLIGCCLYPQFDSVGFGQATQCVGEVLPSSLFFCSWRLFFTQKCRFFCLLDVLGHWHIAWQIYFLFMCISIIFFPQFISLHVLMVIDETLLFCFCMVMLIVML